ncbi:MAG: UDP-N-acetylmuramate dehydrogenase [Azoarcus sp.]|jgi:UDP-N-acetylmuramate dehydrogenase|nr:UDP-N-acetylmuramate dehydrogenase [Azoarcus sp.]
MLCVQTDADLTALNTFGLPARAKHLLRVRSVEEARQACAFLAGRPAGVCGSSLILGGGSNLVLRGEPLDTVLKVEIPGRCKLDQATSSSSLLIEAGAGENWHDFVRWTLDQGWPGLENLSFIPGTVGAAPVQNIGAYGLEVAERIESLDALDLASGELERFDAAACQFGYRDSIFKRQPGRWLITAVRFRLPRDWQPLTRYGELARELAERGFSEFDLPAPLQVSDAVIALRRRKLPDPAELGSAGSFFKNPVVDAGQCAALLAAYPALPHYPQPDGLEKLAAGWLIEQCGWKGRRLGPAGCHAQHALILVNHGGATGADILRLAASIRDDVFGRFGVELEPEPVLI